MGTSLSVVTDIRNLGIYSTINEAYFLVVGLERIGERKFPKPRRGLDFPREVTSARQEVVGGR